MRIFIGLTEITNLVTTYAQGFRSLGHEAVTMVYERHPFYPDAEYDIVVDECIDADAIRSINRNPSLRNAHRTAFVQKKLLELLPRCDVFMFLFGTSFSPGFRDLPLLKFLKKRVICVFLGSDIRYWYAFQQEMQSIGLGEVAVPYTELARATEDGFFDCLKLKVQAAEQHADLIVSQPGYGQLQTKPYIRFNVPLNLSQYQSTVPDREVPLVIHAPSRQQVKGTEYVLSAIDQLKQEGVAVDFRLIQNMPNSEVRALLAEADIVVDELFADTVGVLSTESMATGNVVLVHYPAEFARVPTECPAVNVTRHSLHDVLRTVILDRTLRRQIAYSGRPFVAKHHDHRVVGKQILAALEAGNERQYDFVPTFWSQFSPPPALLAQERQILAERRRRRLRRWLGVVTTRA